MPDQQTTSVVRRIVEGVRELPLRLGMALEGSRYDAHPFGLWWPRCPVCAGSYEGHEFSILGSATPPWEPFVSAVENRDWGRAARIGTSNELIGPHDLAIAAVLLCPIEGRVATLLYRSPYRLTGSHALISQQILNDEMSRELATHLSVRRPVIQDRLKRIREMRARVRELRRTP